MDEIEEIKRRVDVVDLISQYLVLKKAGANYKAPCPFHKEKTPSFMVSQEKQIFKCFGCGKGGSIFDFIMEMEGLNFREALELLANKAGVELKRTKSTQQYQQEKNVKGQLYQINQLAALVYHKVLQDHPLGEEARRYLSKRGIEPNTIKEFLIGYAPKKPVLRNFLLKKGFSSQEINQAGSPDRFYHRIIFPLTDVLNNIVGFTGRALAKEDEPKYLNTPETLIFNKSYSLYGLNKAKQTIKKEQKAILVEGQMDVIMSHQAGITNVVASSGTALTQNHLDILKRYSPEIIFAFDQDAAGLMATRRSIDLAIEREMNVKVVVLPVGFKDAGEAIAKDPHIWQEAVKKALPAVDWYFQLAFGQTPTNTNSHELSVDQKKSIAKELIPIIKKIPNKIEQAHYVQKLAKKLGIKEQIISDALARANVRGRPTMVKEEDKEVSRVKNLSGEETLVTLLILHPEFMDKIMNKLDYKELKQDKPRQIYRFLQSCYTKTNCGSKDKKCNYRHELGSCLVKQLGVSLVEHLKVAKLTVEELYKGSDKDEILAETIYLCQKIKGAKTESLMEEFAQKISQAEKEGSRTKVKELMNELQNILKKPHA